MFEELERTAKQKQDMDNASISGNKLEMTYETDDSTEICDQKTMSKEVVLQSQNNRLSKLVLDLEARRVALVEENNQILSTLEESSAYLWSWDVLEKQLHIQMPSLEKEVAIEDGVYSFDKIIDKIHPEDIQKLQFDGNQAIYITDQTFSVDLRVHYSGMDYTWFEFRGKVIRRDSQGNATFLEGVFLDIQKRKNTELAFMRRIEALQETDRVRSTLFSNFTQEIRTPLHAVVGFADILTTIEDRFERQRYLEIIKNNNDILLNLIENICEYSDAETPEEELKKDVICLWEYLVELHQVYSIKIENNVKLVFSNSYDSRKIIVDKDKLTEVLGILLTNSILSTQRGFISYGFEFGDDKLTLTITDTGNGLQAERVDNLFSSYERMDSLSNSTGFNMSVCKSLVNRMNGEIFVNSKLNVGTTYSIELPLVLDTVSKTVPVAPVVAEYKHELVIKKERQLPVILVAEDVLYGFLMLKTMLQDRFEVVHAENGAHAIELFRETNPVFVFMDIKMPVMDGIEATKRIREISQDVPIVVLTAYAVRSLRKEAGEAGCTDMLTKPTSAKQINATIRKYLKKDY